VLGAAASGSSSGSAWGMRSKATSSTLSIHLTVMIPEENVKDLQEIPENVKNGLEIVPVKWVDKVLEVALEKLPTPLPDEAPAVAAPADGTQTPAASVKH